MRGLHTRREQLWDAAGLILKRNDMGGYSVPTRGLYPYQWLWDAGFVAMGWHLIDQPRAWKELDMLLRGQWASGMLPHITFHQIVDTYFPGPDIWQSPQQNPPTSGITQPPIIATALWDLYRNTEDTATVEPQARSMFQALLRYHRWLYEARDPDKTGLVAILHPWESGMDNSPLWDGPLSRIKPVAVPTFKRRDLNHVNAAHRPLDEDYVRYIYLLICLRNGGYVEPSLYYFAPFCVVDTGYNAILLRANRDLLAMAKALGEPETEITGWIDRAEKGFQRLRDGQGGFYAGFDVRAGVPLDVPVTSKYLTLWGGAASADEALYLAREFSESLGGTSYMAATFSPVVTGFHPQRYWRGPVWAILNWMLSEGFKDYGFKSEAARLRADVLQLVETAGFYEYFDPLTGVGCGGPDFSWTAAVILKILASE